MKVHHASRQNVFQIVTTPLITHTQEMRVDGMNVIVYIYITLNTLHNTS